MCTVVSKQVQVHGAVVDGREAGCVIAEAGCLLVGDGCAMARLTTKEETKKRHTHTHTTHTHTHTHIRVVSLV